MNNLCKLTLLNEPLCNHTTFKVGGNADFFILPESNQELTQAIKVLKKNNTPYFVIGGGSNLVINDAGFRGVVICTKKINQISYQDSLLSCGAGTEIKEISEFCQQNSLSGMETFCGLPGTVGGAVFMNARCYNKSISDVLTQVEFLNLETEQIETYKMNQSDWDYKKSPFQNKNKIVLCAKFKVCKGNPDEIKKQNDFYLQDRENKGHFRFPSAGSVFKNNRDFGEPTGKIIQDAGLLGYKIGGAKISEWHGNIIINENGATAQDIKELVDYIKLQVKEKRNFVLEPEIIFVD